MNRQQRRAQLRAIVEQSVAPRILRAIREEPIDRQLFGLAGALVVVARKLQLPRDQRACLVRDLAESVISEMARMDGLNVEQKEDWLIANHGGWNGRRG